MAISDQQIFDWLVAIPTADDATIAAIMDQFDVTPADVARATGTDVADIQSRYEAVAETPTAPTVIETPTTGGLNAVSVASEPILLREPACELWSCVPCFAKTSGTITNSSGNKATFCLAKPFFLVLYQEF